MADNAAEPVRVLKVSCFGVSYQFPSSSFCVLYLKYPYFQSPDQMPFYPRKSQYSTVVLSLQLLWGLCVLRCTMLPQSQIVSTDLLLKVLSYHMVGTDELLSVPSGILLFYSHHGLYGHNGNNLLWKCFRFLIHLACTESGIS